MTIEDFETRPSLATRCIPYYPDDPPRYEAQASYLKRYRLLKSDERERLKDRHFKPEWVELCTAHNLTKLIIARTA